MKVIKDLLAPITGLGRSFLLSRHGLGTICALALVFLWFWPRGIVPERRRRFPGGPLVAPAEMTDPSEVT